MSFSARQPGAAVLCILLSQATGLLAGQANSPSGGAGLLSTASPESAGMASDRLSRLAGPIQETIERGEVPGAVVLVAREGRVVYNKAFGNRALDPGREPMTVDTVFDMASLTKVVATATSIMILVERGKISLIDTVATYIPEFGKYSKGYITIRNCLTNTTGIKLDEGLKKALENVH